MTGCIVVAAGYGSLREKAGRPVPKVIEKVGSLPMVVRALQDAEKAGITDSIVIVNPRDGDLVALAIESAIRMGWIYCPPDIVVQPERRGSADAVMCATPLLRRRGIERALITYGDMPRWSERTFRMLLNESSRHHIVTMTTVMRNVDYPSLDRYGRVVRSEDGGIAGVIEVNDPAITPDMIELERVNPSLWVWNLAWLEAHIPSIQPLKKIDGYPDELCLPPLIAMAAVEGHRIGEFALAASRSSEALGVNTLAELREIERSYSALT